MQIILAFLSMIMAFIISCSSLFFGFLLQDEGVKSIRANLAMDIKPNQIEFHEDTHGGFLGDGEEIVIFTPNPEQTEKIKAEWKKTPVDSVIASLIFPEMGYNGLELSKHIPNAEGFWFYKNRNESAVHSHNFSFALFDGEKVYYYELDT